jgi:hypothetical protein
MGLRAVFIAIFAFAATSLPAAAQTVGSFDSGNCYPFNCNDSGAATGQSIDYQETYISSAFAGPLTINSITFFAWPGPATQVLGGTYDITFGTTTSPLLTNGPLALSNVATFYDATLTATSVPTSYTINGTPYSYNPASGNLVMEVVVTNQDNVPNGSGNGYFWADYTGAVVSRTYNLGGTGFQGGGTGAIVTDFNGVVPEPSTWVMLVLGFAGLGVAGYRRARKSAAQWAPST